MGLTLLALGGCATTGAMSSAAPSEVIRYHLGEPIERGTIAVEPLTGGAAPASLEFKTYAAAVQGELIRIGYAPPAMGATPQFVASVSYARTERAGQPKRSPISIGIGGGGFSGGRRGGGIGLGGGVGFPVGKSSPRTLVVTELSVTIKRRVDQSPIWEGRAQTGTELRAADADAAGQATKLARALFTGFPGESGRTIEVK